LDEYPTSERANWSAASIDLSNNLPASTISLRFSGYTQDGFSNADDGYYVDDMRVSCPPTTCYNGETNKQLPDQSHDRGGNGNNVDSGDLPSGW
jgi:hypothetical protein